MLLSDWWNFVKIGREARPFLIDNNRVTFTHVGSIRVTFCRKLNALLKFVHYVRKQTICNLVIFVVVVVVVVVFSEALKHVRHIPRQVFAVHSGVM